MGWASSLVSGAVGIVQSLIDRFSRKTEPDKPVALEPTVRVDAEAEINRKAAERVAAEKMAKLKTLKGAKR